MSSGLPRIWYYRPFKYHRWLPVTLGSDTGFDDETWRPTVVIGWPIFGHLVIAVGGPRPMEWEPIGEEEQTSE